MDEKQSIHINPHLHDDGHQDGGGNAQVVEIANRRAGVEGVDRLGLLGYLAAAPKEEGCGYIAAEQRWLLQVAGQRR